MPTASDRERIPFRTWLLPRNRAPIAPSSSSALGHAHYEVQLGDILGAGAPGDHLILEPVNPEDWRAKRIAELGC